MKYCVVLLSLICCAMNATAAQSDYVGQEMREIKSLSQEDIDGLLKGEGMGLAKAAELNRYPGPKHVLDLASELKLTPEQQQQTQAFFFTMQNNAIALGKQLVAKEKALDQAFAQQTIDSTSLQTLLVEIGEINTRLRNVHLAAHLRQQTLLNDEQVQQYNQLRGYHAHSNHSHH